MREAAHAQRLLWHLVFIWCRMRQPSLDRDEHFALCAFRVDSINKGYPQRTSFLKACIPYTAVRYTVMPEVKYVASGCSSPSPVSAETAFPTDFGSMTKCSVSHDFIHSIRHYNTRPHRKKHSSRFGLLGNIKVVMEEIDTDASCQWQPEETGDSRLCSPKGRVSAPLWLAEGAPSRSACAQRLKALMQMSQSQLSPPLTLCTWCHDWWYSAAETFFRTDLRSVGTAVDGLAEVRQRNAVLLSLWGTGRWGLHYEAFGGCNICCGFKFKW